MIGRAGRGLVITRLPSPGAEVQKVTMTTSMARDLARQLKHAALEFENFDARWSELLRRANNASTAVTAKLKSSKLGKKPHHRRVIACDQFRKDDKGLRLAKVPLAAGETTVSYEARPKAACGSKAHRASGVTLTPLSATSFRAQVANTGLTGTKRLKPVAFSRVTDEIRARFAHDALAVLGPVHSITINLGDEVRAQAYRKRTSPIGSAGASSVPSKKPLAV